MKKIILLAGAALVLVGCNKGGTGDTYDSGRGTGTSASTNYNQGITPSEQMQTNQGGATTPGGSSSGATSNAPSGSEGMGGSSGETGSQSGSETSTNNNSGAGTP